MKKLLGLLSFLIPSILMAQDIEMADQMRADGKIYVVIAVVLTILLGLLLYLIWIDRKLTKLEKEISKE